MDYAAIIWHRPGDTRTALTMSQLRKIASVQGRIMRAITGCFRTTAITAMEHETDLISPQWQLTNKVLQTALRMMATANNHPIYTWITKARKQRGSPYLSNLENIVKHFPEYMRSGMEHTSAYI